MSPDDRSRRRPRRGLPVAAVLVLVIATAAAVLGGVSGCGVADATPELSHSHGSPEALARAVLAALEADDREALDALRVTREEYRTLLWEQLPESEHIPFQFAWDLNSANSRKGVRLALSEYGGQSLELVSIDFTGEPEVYEDFTLHFGPKLRVRRRSDGEVGLLPLLDVVLERKGEWKLLNVEE